MPGAHGGPPRGPGRHTRHGVNVVMNPDRIPKFGLTCWPGGAASVGVYEIAPNRPALAVYLDPVMVMMAIPPFPTGQREMARFCRELAREATRLAAQLDSQEQPAAPETPPTCLSRHALRPGVDGHGGAP